MQGNVNNTDIKDIQKVLLEMSANFHSLMTKHNIPYYMLGGTMLGAIRHKGFIPWDDDMDFGIPREYYEKAQSVLEEELPRQYRLLKATDSCVGYDTTKVENVNTVIEEFGSEGVKKGLFIDIFPLDLGNNRWGIFSKNRWIRVLFALNGFKYSKQDSIIGKIIAIVVNLFPVNFFHGFAKCLINDKGDYIINYGGYWGKKEIIHKKVFGVPKLYEFESVYFYGVEDYDSYLKGIYNDYMTLPPENKRHTHIKKIILSNADFTIIRKMKISFILPIYKVEAYLRECVDSLICQTYKDFEIILVDDGSPDGCPALCDQLATEDSRIIALHKPNGGLSDARNYGLLHATGDYVIFVDSDDIWVGKDSLEKLVILIKKYPECQFYGFNCQYYYPDTNTYQKWVSYTGDLLVPVSGSSAMRSLVASGTMPMSAWLKAIDRQWLSDMHITFKVGQISEDVPWFINLLDKCDKCVFVNDYIYSYRQNRAGSITASTGERSFNSLLDIVKTELELIEGRSLTEEAKDALRSFLAYEVSIMIAGTCYLPREKQTIARKELKKLCWLFKYTQNPKVHMVSRVYNLFGYAITESVLRIYNWYRARKK